MLGRWFGLGLIGIAGCQKPSVPSDQAGATTSAYTLPVASCRPCHQAIVDSYVTTAHYRTSALADSSTIRGSFVPGRNTLSTAVRSLAFKMEGRVDGFYQTAADVGQMTSRSERFDLVVGSGRKGQSYLYWKNRLLFQLPVSYLVATDHWINSPGYRDGTADFDRIIPPRCLECHATTFAVVGDSGREYYADSYLLTLSCEKCHGDGRKHVAYSRANPADSVARFMTNPAKLDRDRKLDACGLCHSGPANQLRPAFTFRSGDKLSDFLAPDTSGLNTVPDVHGNQVALLRSSKCFRSSAGMSCATCHNVHRPERDLMALGAKCLQCHQPDRHPSIGLNPAQLRQRCVDCHMPNQRSNAIQINTASGSFGPSYRSHRIAVYR